MTIKFHFQSSLQMRFSCEYPAKLVCLSRARCQPAGISTPFWVRATTRLRTELWIITWTPSSNAQIEANYQHIVVSPSSYKKRCKIHGEIGPNLQPKQMIWRLDTWNAFALLAFVFVFISICTKYRQQNASNAARVCELILEMVFLWSRMGLVWIHLNSADSCFYFYNSVITFSAFDLEWFEISPLERSVMHRLHYALSRFLLPYFISALAVCASKRERNVMLFSSSFNCNQYIIIADIIIHGAPFGSCVVRNYNVSTSFYRALLTAYVKWTLPRV